jgi:hypothetical protein
VAVVAATVAVAYGGYRAYLYFSEQTRIQKAADKAGCTYDQLSKALHRWKKDRGMGGADNLSQEELEKLAEEVANGTWRGVE